jgi:RimJ/RimL family protein N-acetyltransferase
MSTAGLTGAVALDRVTEADLDVLERLTQDPESTGEFAWFGWFNGQRWRRGWADDQLLSHDDGTLMVTRAGEQERLGFVVWHRRSATVTAYYWEIGIALLPQARGHGYGTQAQRLLAEYLFAHTPVHRIEAKTETGNRPEQRALEKAGFSREGVSRGIGWRDGAWRDGVTYSMLRTDPAARPRSSP